MDFLAEGIILANRYRIEKKIGEGEQTEVYKCFDVTHNQYCALKILDKDADDNRSGRFKKEFQELYHLKHPYLVKTLDFAKDPSIGEYYTCELIDGVPLNRKFDAFVPEQVIPIMIQVSQIFSFLHSRGIIHADIKPSSILILEPNKDEITAEKQSKNAKSPFQKTLNTTNYHLKLTGLGLMEIVPLFRNTNMRDAFYYIAPEVAMGRKYDFRADIYSLGILFYELVTHELPFHGESLLALVKSRLRLEPLSPHEINKEISSELASIIMHCIKRRPVERFEAVDDIINELRNAEQEIFLQKRYVHKIPQLLSNDFVGRGEDMAFVENILSKVEQKKGRILLIGGEKNIGKTRLMQEIKLLAQLRGFLSFTSFCSEKYSYSLQPVIELVQQTILHLSKITPEKVADFNFDQSSNVNSFSNDAKIHTKAEVTDAISVTDENSFVDEEYPLEISETSFDKIFQLFDDCSKELPLLLIIDDAHRLDKRTTQFLQLIADDIGSSAMLICVLFRDDLMFDNDDKNKDKPLYDLIRLEAEIDTINSLRLERFDTETTTKLITTVLNLTVLPSGISDYLYNQTEGVPGYIVEAVNKLAEMNILVQDEKKGWRFQDFDHKISINLSSITLDLKTRLKNISKDESTLLQTISVMHHDVREATLQEIIQWDNDRFERNMIRLLKQAFISEETIKDKKYVRIKHHQFAEHVLDKSHPDIISNIHEKAAIYYEKLFLNKDNSVLAKLAFHLSQFPSNPEKQVIYSVKTAMHYLELGNLLDAITYFEYISKHLQNGLSLDIASIDNKTIYLPGDVYMRMGELKSALDWYKSIVDVLEEREIYTLLSIVYQKIGQVYLSIGFYVRALSNYHSGIAKLTNIGETPQTAFLYALTGKCYILMGQVDNALENCERSLKIIERFDDLNIASDIYLTMGNILLTLGDFSEASKYLLRSLKLKEMLDDQSGIARVMAPLGQSCLMRGKLERANNYFQTSLKIFQTHRSRIDQQLLNIYIANYHYCYTGNWEKALQFLKDTQTKELFLSNPYYRAFTILERGKIFSDMGLYDKAMHQFEKSLELFGKMKIPSGEAEIYHAFGQWYLDQGDLVQAEEFLNKSFSQFTNLNFTYKSQCVRTSLAQLSYRKKDYQNAKEELLQLEKYFNDEELPYHLGIIHRNQAMVAMEIGDINNAWDYLRKSEQIFKSIDSEFELAKTFLEMGKTYYRSNQETEANQFMTRANTIFKKIGAKKQLLQLETIVQEIREYSLPYLYGIEEKKGEMATLYRMSQIITSILDLKDLSERLLDMVIESVKAERGLLILCDQFSREIHIKVARNFSSNSIENIDDFSRKAVEEVLNSKEPVLAGDIYGDKRFKSNLSVALFDIQSILCIPLKVRDKVIGVLYVDSKDPKNIFTEKECNFLVALGNHAAIALENALLYQQTRSVLEGIRDGIITINSKGTIKTIDRLAEKLLNLTEAEVVNQNFDEVFTDKHFTELNALIHDTLEKRENKETELTFFQLNHQRKDLAFTSSITKDGYGSMTGIILLLHDISKIKKVQEELELQQRLSAMGELAAKVSHRMKNLLSGIKILTQGLQRECDENSTDEELVSEILLEVDEAEKYVYQTLNPAKALDQKSLMISFSRTIDQVLKQLKTIVAEKQIEVIKEIETDLPPLKINNDLIKEAILNLCVNSIEAMQPNGILHIRLTSTNLVPEIEKKDFDQEGIILEISDTGAGIPIEIQTKIFDPFFTTKEKGSGVGLWLVHKLIKSHKGKISIRSIEQKGTTFTIFLPL